MSFRRRARENEPPAWSLEKTRGEIGPVPLVIAGHRPDAFVPFGDEDPEGLQRLAVLRTLKKQAEDADRDTRLKLPKGEPFQLREALEEWWEP